MTQAQDQSIEQAILATGQTGRRVRMDQIDALMASLKVHAQRIDGTCSTIALAVLPNGFTVAIGHSACVDPAMFNAAIGVDVATADALAQARKKLWELEGYCLKKEIERVVLTDADALADLNGTPRPDNPTA
ncbi:hypothetical protein G167_gp36 [Burkholderia phage BcepMigl]|uniref:Uncharacterized protein n=1 Tax=Burkholderia phage BcepMigl TaxID=2886899 RepID=I6WLP7_9CAUD|nr:hypothetical protein G167_gp36 [Burkholderia phage BcepMigl]AFN39118.1 hypothetical protein BcepMigl_gp49 [Burkholderia phage BcepMigl]